MVGVLCLAALAVHAGSVTNLWAPLEQLVAKQAPAANVDPGRTLAGTTRTLRDEFNRWLEQPARYRARALRECSVFPEGRVYPFAIPALAYANLGIAYPRQRDYAAGRMRTLIDLLVPLVAEDVGPPGGELLRLTHYQKEGTRLSSLNLVLACYALVSDDGRYARLHEHVSRLLRRALIEGGGGPLASYPAYTWYFDTIMALTSLELYDRKHGLSETAPLLRKHLAWRKRHATDPDTGLPIAYPTALPRGCDLSMQVCLLRQTDVKAAQQLYAKYARHHWVDLGFIAGFREWPKGKGQSLVGDIDSAPLILGIGPTASGVGLGAAKAMNDTVRLHRLARQIPLIPEVVRLLEPSARPLFGNRIRISTDYVTGFLYGDAVLFYAITWVPYRQESE